MIESLKQWVEDALEPLGRNGKRGVRRSARTKQAASESELPKLRRERELD